MSQRRFKRLQIQAAQKELANLYTQIEQSKLKNGVQEVTPEELEQQAQNEETKANFDLVTATYAKIIRLEMFLTHMGKPPKRPLYDRLETEEELETSQTS